VRPKKLTNVRNSGSEERVVLTPPRTLGLEDALG
jgi:predicted membrane GTPase involved in stress response